MDFISCLRHAQSKVCYVYLLPDNIEILCDYCLEDNVIKSETFQINKLIHINALLKNPEILFKKLDLDNNILSTLQINAKQNKNKINEQINEVEKLIQDIQGQIQNMLSEFRDYVKKLENLQNQFFEDIKQGLNFDQLKQLLMSLVQSNDVTNPDAIGQLKIKLHQQFQSLQKDNAKEINQFISNKIYLAQTSIYGEIQKSLNFDQLQQKIETFQNYQYKLATSIFPHFARQIESTLFTTHYQQKIMSQVCIRSKRDISKIKLIYLGSKDGLNGESFYQKVNGKQNCLMIFKSKSNHVFGGYSPCEWQQNLNNYVKDNTNSSFLFSQTHDEIYPIINKNSGAIYCYSSYGPTFGEGYDIYIYGDFQFGHSKLGSSFKWDKYQNQKSTHLFGQETPNIVECEIFEITFK